MQPDFGIQHGVETGLGVAHAVQVFAFEYGQTPGTAELDQKQVILLQIVLETFLGQGSLSQLAHEVVLDIGVPVIGTPGF
jgi:hypothetical protein